MDPDQMALPVFSGSTFFSKPDISVFSKVRVNNFGTNLSISCMLYTIQIYSYVCFTLPISWTINSLHAG